MIATPRLQLLPLEERHFAPLAAMHQDAEVTATLGGTWDAAKVRKAFERYIEAFKRDGVSRFAVEDRSGNFLGLAGVLRHADQSTPPGRHAEIGWRFIRAAWGQGFATEAAAATLHHAFATTDIQEIWAYTTADNARSQRVIERLGLQRERAKDFTQQGASGRLWELQVWMARAAKS